MDHRAVIDCLRRLEAKTLASSGDGRDTRPIGPFVAVTHPTNDLIWLSYALLLPDARENDLSPEMMSALREHFRAHNRVLRFEILEPLWPWAGPRLEALGMTLQGRMPLMICLPGQVRSMPLPQDAVERVLLRALSITDSDAIFTEYVLAAKESFGEGDPTVTPQEVAEQRDNIASGRYTSAYISRAGRIAGIGSMSMGNDELVGVATRPPYRRRGIAAAISSHLVQQHFERGAAAVWLSAGDAAAAELYEKIGFKHAGVQLNYMDPVPT